MFHTVDIMTTSHKRSLHDDVIKSVSAKTNEIRRLLEDARRQRHNALADHDHEAHREATGLYASLLKEKKRVSVCEDCRSVMQHGYYDDPWRYGKEWNKCPACIEIHVSHVPDRHQGCKGMQFMWRILSTMVDHNASADSLITGSAYPHDPGHREALERGAKEYQYDSSEVPEFAARAILFEDGCFVSFVQECAEAWLRSMDARLRLREAQQVKERMQQRMNQEHEKTEKVLESWLKQNEKTFDLFARVAAYPAMACSALRELACYSVSNLTRVITPAELFRLKDEYDNQSAAGSDAGACADYDSDDM